MRWISEWFAYHWPLNQDQEHIFWWRNRWDTPNLVKIIKFAVPWPFFHGFLQFSSTFWCVNQCNSRVQGPVDMLCTVICLIYTKIPKLNMKNKINLSLWRPTPPPYIGFRVHIPVPPWNRNDIQSRESRDQGCARNKPEKGNWFVPGQGSPLELNLNQLNLSELERLNLVRPELERVQRLSGFSS